MNSLSIAEQLAKLGPQPKRLSPFMARFCFHQSWFRSEILRVSCAEYGHLLQPEDGAKGLNFHKSDSFWMAKGASKSWLFKFQTDIIHDMTSLETFAFNFFGALQEQRQIASYFLNELLQLEQGEFYGAKINFIEEKYLPYNVTFDTLVDYRSHQTSTKSILAIHFLRSDTSPLAPYLFQNVPEYQYVAALPDTPWIPEALIENFDEPRYNKLWRQYLLLIAKMRAEQSEGYLIVVHHPQDKEAIQTIHHYLSFLNPNSSTFIPIALNTLLESIHKAIEAQNWETRIWLDGPEPPDRKDRETFLADIMKEEHQLWQRWVKTLHQRYVDFSPSEALWQAYQTRNQA